MIVLVDVSVHVTVAHREMPVVSHPPFFTVTSCCSFFLVYQALWFILYRFLITCDMLVVLIHHAFPIDLVGSFVVEVLQSIDANCSQHMFARH